MNDIAKKCPNCGASIEHNYNHKCPYCRTSLHMTDEKIRKLNNCKIKVKDVYIERELFRHELVITIVGISIPKMQWFEEGIDSIVVSGDDIGKRIGYRIAVPLEEFYHEATPNKIIERIIRSLPPAFEESQDFILYEIIDKFYSKRLWEV